MNDKVTDIPLKLVIIECNRGAWKEFKVATTPVSVEALLGTIYQLKSGATLHRMRVKSRAITAKVIVGKDAIVVKESKEVIEYVNKTDLEPYELSDYDKERLAEYNKRISGKDLFDKIVMPNILAIVKEYDLEWIKDKKKVLLADKYTGSVDYYKSDHEERHKEIADKLKALGCKVTVPNFGPVIYKININRSVANMGLV